MSKQQRITHMTDIGCETQWDFIAVEKVPDFSGGQLPAWRHSWNFLQVKGLEVQLSFPLQ
jgi:hypothetical protein